MTDSAPRPRLVAMVPTYNERENIADLIDALLALPVEAEVHVLVADDNSPDGTGRYAEERAAAEPLVHALVRTKRRGRGAGGIDGFKAALALDPDYIVEMDADFSHQPKYIPDLLAAAKYYDLVLGSRYVKNGRDADRRFLRRLISFFVRTFIRRLYRIKIKDVSSGFRLYRREVLEAVDLDDLVSVGQSVVLEILRKVELLGFRIGEVPIVFIDRTRGRTKLDFLALLETLLQAVKFRKRYTRETVKAAR